MYRYDMLMYKYIFTQLRCCSCCVRPVCDGICERIWRDIRSYGISFNFQCSIGFSCLFRGKRERHKHQALYALASTDDSARRTCMYLPRCMCVWGLHITQCFTISERAYTIQYNIQLAWNRTYASYHCDDFNSISFYSFKIPFSIVSVGLFCTQTQYWLFVSLFYFSLSSCSLLFFLNRFSFSFLLNSFCFMQSLPL